MNLAETLSVGHPTSEAKSMLGAIGIALPNGLDRGLFNPTIEIVIVTKLVLQLIKVTPFFQNLVGYVQTSGNMPPPDMSEFVTEKTIELINSKKERPIG